MGRDRRPADRKRPRQASPGAPARALAVVPRPVGVAGVRRLTRGQHLLLGLVLLLALLLRGGYLWGQYRNNPVFGYPQMDGLVHHEWAQRIAAGAGMGDRPYLRAPLYYYLLGLLYVVTGPSVLAARLAGGLLGALSCYLVARLGVALGGFRVGLIAGGIFALYWPAIYFDAELLTAGLEVFLNVALLWALLAAGRRDSLALYLLAGILWGLSAITRPNVLVLAPAIVIWSWLAAPARSRVGQRLRGAALAAAGLVIVVLPVTLRNYFVGGEAVLIASAGGINFYIGNNPESTGYLAAAPGLRPTWDEWLVDLRQIPETALGRKLTDGEVSDYWYEQAWAWVRAEPGAWLRHMFRKLGLFWSPIEIPNNQSIWFLARQAPISFLFWIGFAPVACLALPAAMLLGRRDRAWFLPLAFLVLYMATVVAFFCPARFRLPAVPVLVILAAAGACQLVDWVRRREFKPAGIYAALAVVCAVLLALTPPSRGAFRRQEEVEGHYLRARAYATLPPRGPGDLRAALAEYRAALQLDPHSMHRQLAVAQTLVGLNEIQEADAQYAQAVAEHPDSVPARREYAQFLAATGRPNDALAQLRVALQLHPRDADTQLATGRLLAGVNQFAPAAEHLRIALELRPDPAVHYDLGVVRLRQGLVQDAISAFEAVLREQPEHAQALQNLGVAHARLGDLARAITAFQEALRHDPTLSDASCNLARALGKQGRWADALRVLRQARQQANNNVSVLTALAWLLATAPDDAVRNGAQALEAAEQAAAYAGTPPLPTLDALAAAYAEVGRFEDAVGAARQALSLARSANAAAQVEALDARLQLYEQQRPYREPTP